MTMENSKVVPENIKIKIFELKRLETFLGHLPTENLTINELQKRTEDAMHLQSIAQMETQTEILFSEICEDLLGHKFNYTEIAHAINEILSFPQGIKYCNEIEVRDALGID